MRDIDHAVHTHMHTHTPLAATKNDNEQKDRMSAEAKNKFMPLCCCSLLPGLQEGGTGTPLLDTRPHQHHGHFPEQAGLGVPLCTGRGSSILEGQTQVASAGGVPIHCFAPSSLTESAPSFLSTLKLAIL